MWPYTQAFLEFLSPKTREKMRQTFWGCCKTNACAQSGCPDGDLEPAILNRQDQLSAYHATGGSTTISSATVTSSPSSSTSDASVNVANASSSTTTPGTTTTFTSATASAQAGEKTPVAAIAGGAAGGAFALAVVVGFVIQPRQPTHLPTQASTTPSTAIHPLSISTRNPPMILKIRVT
ncbi:unnamed protein product [Alternaria alternata]